MLCGRMSGGIFANKYFRMMSAKDFGLFTCKFYVIQVSHSIQLNLTLLSFCLGSYSDGNDQFCTVCPVGKFCPFTNNSTQINCEDGTYSWGYQEQCALCPSGWMCPNKDGTGNVKCLPVRFNRVSIIYFIMHH